MVKAGEGPNPIDIHVGRRVRLRRKELGISQERLAEGLGLTFQQVHFFEGLDDPASPLGDNYASAYNSVIEDMLSEPNGPQLAEAFLRIRRRSIRRGLADLAREIAANDTQAEAKPRSAAE